MKAPFSLCSATLCVSLSCYQLASGENIFPAMAGARQRGGWLSSGAATCWLLALIWRGRSRDLTALPQKSGPSDAWEGDLLPPHVHTHTHTAHPALPARHAQVHGRPKSKRAVGQSASVQLRPVSADLPDGSQRVQADWEGGEVVGWRGGGARTEPTL